jgi:CRP-like cAMP-binding protein
MANELDLGELAKVSRLFEVLDAHGRKALLSLSHRILAQPGQVICREGDPGGEFFVITDGQVRVSAEALEGEKEIAILTHGQFFGEMAVLNGDRRTATCTAVGPVSLVAFPSDAVEQILAEYPAAREALHKVGVLRTEDTMQKIYS